MAKLRTIAVLTKENNRNAEEVALRFVEAMVKSGFEIVAVEPLSIPSIRQVSEDKAPKEKVDAVIAVGGDGTVLRALRTFDNATPLLAVNAGGLGILPEAKPEQLEEVVDRLLTENFYLEKRLKLAATISGHSYPPAANDVYITRATKIRTPMYSVMREKTKLFEQRMDGVIIATPTGSTGHSLSAGGPVVSSDLDALLVTPTCPILRLPPIVIPTGEIEVVANEPTELVIDGQKVFPVPQETPIIVGKHLAPAVFIRFEQMPLRQLFNLGYS